MFLFDTDTLSEVLKRNPSPGLMARLAWLPAGDQFTTSITVGEMSYGAHRSSQTEYLLQHFEELLWPMVQILPFDRASGKVYGSLRADLERAGTPLAEPRLAHRGHRIDQRPDRRYRQRPPLLQNSRFASRELDLMLRPNFLSKASSGIA